MGVWGEIEIHSFASPIVNYLCLNNQHPDYVLWEAFTEWLNSYIKRKNKENSRNTQNQSGKWGIHNLIYSGNIFQRSSQKKKSHKLPVLNNFLLSDGFIMLLKVLPIVKGLLLKVLPIYFRKRRRYLSTLSLAIPPLTCINLHKFTKQIYLHTNTNIVCITNRNTESFYLWWFSDFFFFLEQT